jgi:hypothetical protein
MMFSKMLLISRRSPSFHCKNCVRTGAEAWNALPINHNRSRVGLHPPTLGNNRTSSPGQQRLEHSTLEKAETRRVIYRIEVAPECSLNWFKNQDKAEKRGGS